MYHANNEKWEKKTVEVITKSEKHLNVWREGKLQNIGTLEADTIKQTKMKKKASWN